MSRILLVEDNEHIMGINEWFLKTKGYQIDKAYTLKEAESILEHSDPDVIVLDIMLPDGDGIDFCEKLQEKRHIPVLFLTAKTGEKDIMDGYRRGGNDYLTKPYELDMLLIRIEAMLRLTESKEHTNMNAKCGALSFDPVTSSLTVNDEKIILSNKEFGILYYLFKNKGRSVSKETLLKDLWELDPAVDTDTSVIWSTVYRLKKKIAPYSDFFYIDSDHSGYELVIIENK